MVRELSPDEEIITDDLPPPVKTARLMGEDEPVFPDMGEVEKFGRGANVGLAQTFGAPVDLMTAGLNFLGLNIDPSTAVGGSASLQRGLAALGISPPPEQQDPDTLSGSIGKMTGASAAALIPFGAATRGMAAGKEATTVFGKLAQDIARSAVTSPKTFIAAELAGSAGAGTGGYIAREKFPESNLASVTGELLGGLTPAVGVGVMKLTPSALGIRYARKLGEQFDLQTSTMRAEKRLQESARHAGEAVKSMEDDLLPILTPAQKTKDAGLISLEKAVIASSDELTGQADDQIAQATKTIRESTVGIGEGAPIQRTEENLLAAREYLSNLLDTRIKISVQRANEKLADLGPRATREEANLIAREQLEKALDDARAQEKTKWSDVPKEVILSTTNSKTKYAETMLNTPKAQKEDVPEIATKFLSEKGVFKDTESVAELQGLRSKLLEESRKARAAGNYNTARIADDLSDAILADLGAQRENVQGMYGHALRSALDFSFDLNEKFTRGTVARILGTEKRGGLRTPEALTLETTAGIGGPRAKVEVESLFKAADTPELRGAVEDFLLDDFQRRVVRNGEIDPGKLVQYMGRYRDILDDFPDLRLKIEAASRANDASIAAQNRAEGLARKLNDPKVSRAAVFLKGNIESGLERVAGSSSPGKNMAELVRQSARDETGDSLRGLKTGFGDLLIQKASTRTPTAFDDFVVSGRTMKNLLGDGPLSEMAKELFSPDEINRLRVIAETAERLELAVAAKPHKGGIIIDPPNMMFSIIARVGGAQLGRKIAEWTGGGTVQTPGILSGMAKNLLEKKVKDPAAKILIAAMQDEELFKALMTNQIVISKQQKAAVEKQLNAWLAGILTGDTIEESD